MENCDGRPLMAECGSLTLEALRRYPTRWDHQPLTADGDIVLVDPGRQANPGDRVIVRLDDHHEVTCKQLLIEGGRRLLKALNPEWAPRYIEINGNATITGVFIGKWVSE
jgi:SOS-response transcriptional repressor LexA